MHRRSLREPVVWLLFSAGGMAAAFLLPVLLLLFGLVLPLRLVSPGYEHLLAVLSHPITRLVLLVALVLSLFHWAHRFRKTLEEGLQLQRFDGLITTLCYGSALVGSAISAVVLLGLRA